MIKIISELAFSSRFTPNKSIQYNGIGFCEEEYRKYKINFIFQTYIYFAIRFVCECSVIATAGLLLKGKDKAAFVSFSLLVFALGAYLIKWRGPCNLRVQMNGKDDDEAIRLVKAGATLQGLEFDSCGEKMKQYLTTIGFDPAVHGLSKKGFEDAVANNCSDDKLPFLESLLKNGSISEDTRGMIVLNASKNGHPRVVKLMLKNGSIPQRYRNWATQEASDRNYSDIVEVLLQNGPISEAFRSDILHRACQHGNLDIFKALLANKLILDEDRARAVREASSNGHAEMAEFIRTALAK